MRRLRTPEAHRPIDPTRMHRHVASRRGFTLLELLVVVTVIGILVTMLLPAVMTAQEAARRIQCVNNLRQLTLAVLSYEVAKRRLPPSAIFDFEETEPAIREPWGVHGRILPYLDEGALFDCIELKVDWERQPVLDRMKIGTFQCPSDGRSKEVRDSGTNIPRLYPTNYGFNMGTWFVYDPATGQGGDGLFYPNSRIRLAEVRDGTSKTALCAEVLSWTYHTGNGGPTRTVIPNSIAAAQRAMASGPELKNSGHTAWPAGEVHHTGYTATLEPNSAPTFTMGTGTVVTSDYSSWPEGKDGVYGKPTYAIVTSRSRHSGIVVFARLDGSVTYFGGGDLPVWRAYATRSGGEFDDREFD